METVADLGPVLLAFDDLQFLDPARRDVLFLMTRRLERMPTLILAAARAGAAELGPEEGARGGLAWQETIEMRPLDRPQALSLIGDLSAHSDDVSAEIRETIVRLAQGNPYHIEMLLSHWRTKRRRSSRRRPRAMQPRSPGRLRRTCAPPSLGNTAVFRPTSSMSFKYSRSREKRWHRASWGVWWGSTAARSSGRRSRCWIAASVAWKEGGSRSRMSYTGRTCTTRWGRIGANTITRSWPSCWRLSRTETTSSQCSSWCIISVPRACSSKPWRQRCKLPSSPLREAPRGKPNGS